MCTKKIVFLDFDGVLNHAKWFHAQAGLWNSGPIMRDEDHFDPRAVDRLNNLIDRTEAVVVVSSTWRLHLTVDELANLLQRVGFRGKVFGKTPELPTDRGLEIQAWLELHARPDPHFVILDDNADMAHLSAFLVQTSFAYGLQDEHVARAYAILMNDDGHLSK